MKLQALRFSFQDKCTIGHWIVDGADSGLFSLEGKYREVDGQPVSSWKVPGHTAIPKGAYKLKVTFSPHFQMETPELVDVPGYTEVRIHPGNTDLQTEGCLLSGKTWAGGDFIGQSRDAFAILFQKIKAALAAGEEVTLEVA